MNKLIFPCTQCGLCCKHISKCTELKEFDIGNGICRYLTANNTCEIYAKRPSVCRGEYIYKTLFANKMNVEIFCEEILKICKYLQENHLSHSEGKEKIINEKLF